MQFKRTALLALSALSLAACGSDDDGPTGGSGLNDAQRFAIFGDLVEAGNNAAARGAPNVQEPFFFAGFATLFGASTATINATSNGLALSVAGDSPNFATAGSYQVVGIRIIDIENYGGGESETFEFNGIIARRDTSEVIWALGDDAQTFNFATDNVFGGIYSAPNQEWIATTGTASLTNANQGSECNLSQQIRAALEQQLEDDGTLQSWECRNATFSGSINITASQPNAHAANSRTASLSGSVPGVIVTATYDYSGTVSARRQRQR